jgi:hypothetical protein
VPVIAPVRVGDLRLEEVVIRAPDQSALGLRDVLQRAVGHHETPVDVFGEDQHIGVLEDAAEHPLLLAGRQVGRPQRLDLGGQAHGPAP